MYVHRYTDDQRLHWVCKISCVMVVVFTMACSVRPTDGAHSMGHLFSWKWGLDQKPT